MKYTPTDTRIPQTHRKALNEKVIYLIDRGNPAENGITQEDIFNAYTGDGGLHGLNRSDYDSYHSYSEAKKEIENGQFFTPAKLCQLVVESLQPTKGSLIADLTCGMGSFFNYLPVESNLYGCELDIKAYKVAHYLYPDADITWEDIRTYSPGVRFDYVLGNPPFNLKWVTEEYGKLPSQMYYCMKAASLLKPMGILAIIVPESFLADDFTDCQYIQMIEKEYSFLVQAELEKNGSRVLLEMTRASHTSSDFQYQIQKMLYQIQVHPVLKEKYPKCCEHLHRFYTQKQPADIPYETWLKARLTEAKVLAYFRKTLSKQKRKAPKDEIRLVLRNGNFIYKGYSGHTKRLITGTMRELVPVYQAVLNNVPDRYPGYERLLRRKRKEYDIQNTPFSEMQEDSSIGAWLTALSLWESEYEETIKLNPAQRHDLNLVLQKRYTLLQWEQGSGKTRPVSLPGFTGCSTSISIVHGWYPPRSPFGITGMKCCITTVFPMYLWKVLPI